MKVNAHKVLDPLKLELIVTSTPIWERCISKQGTLLIFSLQKLQVFTVAQIPLQFHCIFYRQPMQILNVKTAKKYLQWVVCKKCSETAVGFVTQ